jgi:hypothetical protein
MHFQAPQGLYIEPLKNQTFVTSTGGFCDFGEGGLEICTEQMTPYNNTKHVSFKNDSAADFQNAGSDINTKGKEAAVTLFGGSPRRLLYTTGSDPTDPWKDYNTNATIYTPS